MNNYAGSFMTGGVYLAILVVYTLPIWFIWIWVRDDLQSAVNAVFTVSKLIFAGILYLSLSSSLRGINFGAIHPIDTTKQT